MFPVVTGCTAAYPVAPRLLALALGALLLACDDTPSPRTTDPIVDRPEFFGSVACRDCHAPQFQNWLGSHHDLAMQAASADTVLGDFRSAEFEYFGKESRFFTRGAAFFVATEGADGKSAEFQVRYTFGVEPLQQYLVDIGDGRLQALPLAWDTRPSTSGGQRWFHLYTDQPVMAGHPLHWSGREQNWNYQCAECHSTNVRMNYDAASDRFDTTYAEIDVGCEACHGPGSLHIEQANSGRFSHGLGLAVDLDDRGRAAWTIDDDTGMAARSEPRMRPPAQPEACGRCHARRGRLGDDYQYGQPLTHTHLPALLVEPLYFPDGQIKDEVYVYGSFLQSAMYRAGVSCSDCHDPHSARLVTAGGPDGVCSQCHRPTRFENSSHHGHDPGQVACVDCHMPARVYMGIDARRDHSFRIPRPDISEAHGTPDPCAACHADRGPGWADTALRRLRIGGRSGRPHYGNALAAARRGYANGRLLEAIANRDTPGIARATALSLMSAPLSRSAAAAIANGLNDPDSLVRIGALLGAARLRADDRVSLVAPLLNDTVRGVRIEAAQTLAGSRHLLPAADERAFMHAAVEFRHVQRDMLNRPEAHLNLGSFEAALGNLDAATTHFEAALRLEPQFTAARINLVDVWRRRGDEHVGERLLRQALAAGPDNAALRHALGLLLVRTGRRDAAVDEFRRAAELDRDDPRFVYVYGVALHSSGEDANAIRVLGEARRHFPTDIDIGWALATILRDHGDIERAAELADELLTKHPEHPNVRALRDSLRPTAAP